MAVTLVTVALLNGPFVVGITTYNKRIVNCIAESRQLAMSDGTYDLEAVYPQRCRWRPLLPSGLVSVHLMTMYCWKCEFFKEVLSLVRITTRGCSDQRRRHDLHL